MPFGQLILRLFSPVPHCRYVVGTEELAHLEMVGTLVHQLSKNATTGQIENSPMAAYFIDHGKGVFPTAAAGTPWNAGGIAVKGDPIADLVEDMAAEESTAHRLHRKKA